MGFKILALARFRALRPRIARAEEEPKSPLAEPWPVRLSASTTFVHVCVPHTTLLKDRNTSALVFKRCNSRHECCGFGFL